MLKIPNLPQQQAPIQTHFQQFELMGPLGQQILRLKNLYHSVIIQWEIERMSVCENLRFIMITITFLNQKAYFHTRIREGN